MPDKEIIEEFEEIRKDIEQDDAEQQKQEEREKEKEKEEEKAQIKRKEEEKREEAERKEKENKKWQMPSLRDIPWIISLIAPIVIATLIWRLLGFAIATAGMFSVIAILYLLAGQNIFFVSLPQTSAIAIMYGSGDKATVHRIIQSNLDGTIEARNSRGAKIEPYWFEKVLNLWWLGIPFIGRVHDFTIEVMEEEREEVIGEKGQIEIKVTRRMVDKTLDHLSLKEEVYKVILAPLLCAENFDVIISMAVYIRAVDAQKALFNVGNFLKAIITEIEMLLRQGVSTKDLEELKEQQSEISEKIFENLKKEKTERLRFKTDWGEDLRAIGVIDITPEKQALEELKKKKFAQIAADVEIEKGRGQQGLLTKVGIGEAAAIEARYEAIRAKGKLGERLRKYDVLEKFAESPNKTFALSMPEITELFGKTAQTTDAKINIGTIKTMFAAAGITALTSEQIINTLEAIEEGKDITEIIKNIKPEKEPEKEKEE